MLSYLKEMWDTRELLANLTIREIKGKYRRTVLGQLWSLVHPLATMLVYTVVFDFLFKASPPPGNPSGLNIYPVWLMCGYLPWTFFTHTVNGSLTSIVSGSHLIKKIYFPRMHLPLARTGSVGFTWLNEMGLLAVVILICGGWVLPWLPLVLVFMILLALFAAGIGMLLAILNVHFRDTEHFIGILLRLLLYLTPVLYPISRVQKLVKHHGEWVLDVFRLNPLEHFMAVFRNLLYDNRAPALSDVIWCLASAVVVFIIGSVVFVRNERRLVMYL
jgi:ABC-type polysaccharide/polyol phosphate export permease